MYNAIRVRSLAFAHVLLSDFGVAIAGIFDLFLLWESTTSRYIHIFTKCVVLSLCNFDNKGINISLETRNCIDDYFSFTMVELICLTRTQQCDKWFDWILRKYRYMKVMFCLIMYRFDNEIVACKINETLQRMIVGLCFCFCFFCYKPHNLNQFSTY